MKRLSFRFVRRLMLLLALVFPVVYLMGGFVAALAGSHGNVTLAQDDDVVTSSQIVDFNQSVINGNFSDGITNWNRYNVTASASNNIVTITSSSDIYGNLFQQVSVLPNHQCLFIGQIKSDGTARACMKIEGTITAFAAQTTSTSFVDVNYLFTSGSSSIAQLGLAFNGALGTMYVKNVMFIDLTQMYGAGNEPTAEEFRSRYNADYYDYVVSNKLVEETTGTPTYSEYLFNQVLGSDNIIKQWGYYALSDEDKGFAPFATLIKIVDDNFFHLGDSNDLGLFVYGYVYYALNIVAIYELVALVVMVFTIPLKLTDRFTKEM